MQPWATTADPEPQDQVTGTPAISTATAAILACNRTRILTGQDDSLYRVRICPRSAYALFHKNDMQRCNDGQDCAGELVTDGLTNALAVSFSRHRIFDAGIPDLAPKCGMYVAHFVKMTAHYAPYHHNRPVKLPQNLA